MKDTLTIEIPIQPRTKKNSSQIIMIKGRPMLVPSKLYREYEKNCAFFIPKLEKPINYPVNVKCTYFMETKRKVDLCNLLEATCDVLTHYGVLEDDNRNIIASHDGSRVFYDKSNPRCIIEITPVLDYETWS